MRGQGNQTEQASHPLTMSKRGAGAKTVQKEQEINKQIMSSLIERTESESTVKTEEKALLNIFYFQKENKVNLDFLLKKYVAKYNKTIFERKAENIYEKLKSIELADQYFYESKNIADDAITNFLSNVNQENLQKILDRNQQLKHGCFNKNMLKSLIEKEIYVHDKANHPQYVAQQLLYNYLAWRQMNENKKQVYAGQLIGKAKGRIVYDCNCKIAKVLNLHNVYLGKNQTITNDFVSTTVKEKFAQIAFKEAAKTGKLESHFELINDILAQEIIEQLANYPDENIDFCLEQAVKQAIIENDS